MKDKDIEVEKVNGLDEGDPRFKHNLMHSVLFKKLIHMNLDTSEMVYELLKEIERLTKESTNYKNTDLQHHTEKTEALKWVNYLVQTVTKKDAEIEFLKAQVKSLALEAVNENLSK